MKAKQNHRNNKGAFNSPLYLGANCSSVIHRYFFQSSGARSHPVITDSRYYPAGDEHHFNPLELIHIRLPSKTDAIQLVMGIISTSWDLSPPITRNSILHSLLIPLHLKQVSSMAFRNQVSSFIQSLPDNLWEIHPRNQLAWLRYFKDLKPDTSFLSWLIGHFNPNTMVFRFEDSEVTPTYEEMCAIMGHHPVQDETPALPPGPRCDLAEIAALCPVYRPGGIDPNQGLPLEPFLNRGSMDVNPSWGRACCFLLLNMYALLNVYAMKNRQPGIGDFRLLTVVRDMQVYRRTVFMMIIGETMCWVRDIALHVTNFNIHHRGCPMLLQAWALDKLRMIPSVLASSIPTYGPANFWPCSRGQFDFGDNPVIRWTCPWWRIRLATAGSVNLSYVLYASLDRSMAYFPDRIHRQYGVVQRIPRAHNFESGSMTPNLLTNLADRWRNQNTWYMGQGVMQDTVTPEYIDWFHS
ncbi:hypothetical protein JCGZ_00319 [Jatropha curcas]|uniref:Aminotransferase-like plant mobile domain-containing protein n=1 Tax=Jatropha curcas TaxID=180498 RepID=A0A067JK87_JATCU|nr:hypothetical protein JCGZ_00319 [Jatropha curcas]